MPIRLTVKQVAEMWACSPKHVYNLVARGELAAIYVGDLVRLRPEDIEEFERCHGQKALPPPIPSPSVAEPIASNGGTARPHAGSLAARAMLARRNAS